MVFHLAIFWRHSSGCILSELANRVATAFAPDGPLAAADSGFRPRPGQTQMALAVAQTLQTGGALVAEAATGVGKTFAYLVPALLGGNRVLLSTATKTLQDQLYGRDLPRLIGALGLPVRAALLKGRASYLCPYRLELARHEAPASAAAARALARIERWAQATPTGDLAELPELDERSPVIALVTSTRDNCLGSECPRFRDCHVARARREALAADVVVINHHLFFADLAIRESGMAELLPTARAVVFDEAHQLNETGIQFLGQQLGHRQLQDFARDLLAAGLQRARGLQDWAALAGGVENALRALRLAAGNPPAGSARWRWTGPAPEGVPEADWLAALARLQAALEQAAAACEAVQDAAADFPRLLARAERLAALAARFAQPAAPDAARWLDVGLYTLQLVESPLDIAQTVRQRLLGVPAAGESAESGESDESADPAEAPRAWVFVSATLGDDPKLTWFTRPCGLEGAARILRVGSPFDYARQAAFYVPAPAAFPRPADAAHPAAVAQLAGDVATRLGGRTLVLTTTLRALRSISQMLAERFRREGVPIAVLAQGELPKRVLMERFRAGKASETGCVLVASASFWEGVDVPGPALQCVVIDKLPFPPPGDPLVQARSRRIEAAGGSAFAALSLPEAAVALKQGAGRLIRCETDTGVLIVCDTRLLGMSYGKRLLAALPPMRRLANEAQLAQVLDALAVSTQAAPESGDAISF